MNHKKIVIFSIAIVFLFGTYFFLYTLAAGRNEANYQKLIALYPYLSKRILNDHENDLILSFVDLRKALRTAAAEYGDTFAFFFEYLPTGVSIGVNEKNDFNLASLLKVPYVMAYYLQQQDIGLTMNPTAIIQDSDLDSQFGSLWQKGAGYQLTMSDVVKRTLIDSDDTAVQILKRYVGHDAYQQVYDGLDIELTQNGSDPPKLSAKSYTSILKALYFSAILSRDQSQGILGLLTQTPFDDKLAAGVPRGIPVAHKIGVINNDTYSDCGIVYEPQRPYALCMISHSSEDVARERMKKISSIVYQYVHGVK